MSVLITGGAGYIGSHTCLALMESGIDVIVLDNLSNSSMESLRRVAKLAGYTPFCIHGDIRNGALLDKIFSEHRISAVLHFAGLKSIEESILHPLRYYDNNICGTQVLLQAMQRAGVFSLVFSSSATVYGNQAQVPVSESMQVGRPINPYGRSKLIVEDIIRDLAISDSRWRIAILRYFNPVGAHQSGLIGEDPKGIPNNLLPSITQVALGKLPELMIYGYDYPTQDGTAVRDYIHVQDLAGGHLKALDALKKFNGTNIWNLGTGKGFSVLEVVHAFELACGYEVPYRLVQRREGDIAICYADPTKAERDLGWKAEKDLPEMMRDAWRWHSLNPNGFTN